MQHKLLTEIRISVNVKRKKKFKSSKKHGNICRSAVHNESGGTLASMINDL